MCLLMDYSPKQRTGRRQRSHCEVKRGETRSANEAQHRGKARSDAQPSKVEVARVGVVEAKYGERLSFAVETVDL
jgi:hypothetical protein